MAKKTAATLASALVLCAALGGCGANQPNQPEVLKVEPRERTPMFNMMDVFGDEKLLDAVRKASSATAVRLKQPNYEEQDQMKIQIVGPSQDLDERLSTELAKTLTEESSYEFEGIKGCAPDYGIRVTLETTDGKIDVFFCFGCDVLTIYRHGNIVGGRDFDPARTRLLKIFKQIFSEDEDIQELR